MKEIKSGIYYIYNIVTNQYYIGSSRDLHKRHLVRNIHVNKKLQHSWNKSVQAV
jgi:hypothetical protein